MMLKYDLNETARYMGYKHGAMPDENVCKLIDKAYNELCNVITPKYIYKQYDFARTEDGILIEGIEFKSQKLLYHLRDSNAIILFGATLGQGPDTLIHKYSITDVPLATVAHAVAASLVENLCDAACEELVNVIGGEHRPRFSPGYGDLQLSSQQDFFKLLSMNKQLGVFLTENLMMKPYKTVTAFIGIKK